MLRRKIKRIWIPVIFCSLSLLATGLLAYLRPNPFLLGGIQVNEADHGHWFDALRDAGMNTVSVTVYGKQGDWNTDHFWYEEEEEAVVSEIRGAKARGLNVVLIMRVALDHAFPRNQFLWHGMIMPETKQQLDSWFQQYREFVLKWAQIAETEGVDVFGVGSEMNALASTAIIGEVSSLEQWYLDPNKQAERREVLLANEADIESRHLWESGENHFESLEAYIDSQTSAWHHWAGLVAFHGREGALERINRRRARLEGHWRYLIQAVRKLYRGKLTYAANFDQFHQVTFWNELDYIGINAYFQLRDHLEELDDPALFQRLVQGWEGVLSGLVTFRRDHQLEDKPFLFTEIGYTYRANSTLQPWAGSGFSMVPAERIGQRLVIWDEQPRNFTERALAIRALHTMTEKLEETGEPLLAGLLYWKLSTEPSHADIEPFVYILNSDSEDPMGLEMRRFTTTGVVGRWMASLSDGF